MATSMGIGPDNKSIRATLEAVQEQNEILRRQLQKQEQQIANASRNSNIGLTVALFALFSSLGIFCLGFMSRGKSDEIIQVLGEIKSIIDTEKDSVTALPIENSDVILIDSNFLERNKVVD